MSETQKRRERLRMINRLVTMCATLNTSELVMLVTIAELTAFPETASELLLQLGGTRQ